MEYAANAQCAPGEYKGIETFLQLSGDRETTIILVAVASRAGPDNFELGRGAAGAGAQQLAVSAVEIYYEQPSNTGGLGGVIGWYAHEDNPFSLFNPFWTARLTDPKELQL